MHDRTRAATLEDLIARGGVNILDGPLGVRFNESLPLWDCPPEWRLWNRDEHGPPAPEVRIAQAKPPRVHAYDFKAGCSPLSIVWAVGDSGSEGLRVVQRGKSLILSAG